MITNNKILKKTKIIATLGPSTDNINILKNMIYAGVDIVRINFSHANYQDVRNRIKMIKQINNKYGCNVSVLGDLQGPKLRIGKVKDNIIIKKNNYLKFTNNKLVSEGEIVYLNYKQLSKDVKIGDTILLDDGKIILKCVNIDNYIVNTKIIQGGELKSNKGVNLPNTKINLPALTKKDIQDLLFAIQEGVDFIALSFVRNTQDINYLKNIISKTTTKHIPIISKIEKPEAVKNIKEILHNSDAIMIARGDLGVELPLEKLPIIQKNIIHKALKYKKPVIVATQMMENMIHNITPTRAEVNDVANAVIDKTDALMLSAETSIGLYPIQVVQQMSKIIHQVENKLYINNYYSYYPEKPLNNDTSNHEKTISKICYITSKLAKITNAIAINNITNDIYIPIELSFNRPSSYIIIFTNNKYIVPILNLLWGVIIYLYKNNELLKNEIMTKITQKIIFSKNTQIQKNKIINVSNNTNIKNEKNYCIKLINL